ncbi:hypothetical protein [Bifidobacterium boum]|uniref:hypothetical protein n=1 Tax=Bifidobacterium boum TaxID=78343 RepID=UPI002431E76B|nr:hypothetical protein [Bifidobacterium boum]MCI5861984.1 hypothetical protein [Bifidobacterium boum]
MIFTILAKDYDIIERSMRELREQLESVELDIRTAFDVPDDLRVLDAGDRAMIAKLTLLADCLHQADDAAKDAGDHADRMIEKLNLAAYNAKAGDVEG